MRSHARSVCLSALFATLLTVGAWIMVPLSIPYTMQSFVLYCAMWLLSPQQSFAAIGLYLMMGAVGLPVFAGFQGGLGVLFGPTSGYFWGFLLMPLLMFICKKKMVHRVIMYILGTLISYTLGTLWYTAVYAGMSLAGFLTALSTCVLPFIIPDALKLMLAVFLCRRIEPLLSKM